MIRVAYGVPAYRRGIDIGHNYQAFSLGMLSALVKDRIAVVSLHDADTCDVAHSRNLLLHSALKSGADWLLMMDGDTFHVSADTLTAPSQILRMIEDANEHGAAVAAAPVKMRGRDGYNVAIRRGDEYIQIEREDIGDRMIPVERIGTACMAVNCHWIKDYWPEQPWFDTAQIPGEIPRREGSDYRFCDAVRARGGAVLCDARFEPKHVG